MKKRISYGTLASAAGLVLGLATSVTHAAEIGDDADHEARGMLIDSYCAGCHNLDDFAGGFAFDLLDMQQLQNDSETWTAVIGKLGAGMMPPPGEPRPDTASVQAFLAALKQDLQQEARANPDPGAPLLHRLNRSEYENAIRDLLHLPVDVSELLPADDSSEGFDNIANVLSVSPALMQAYISAAAKISRLAVGDMTAGSSISTYRAPEGSQTIRLDGMPLGTRGGLLVRHVFPLDAEYELTVSRTGASTFVSPVGVEDAIEIAIDGVRVHVFEPGAAGSIKVPVTAGPHTVSAAFLYQRQPYGLDDLTPVLATSTSVASLAVNGPMNPTGAGDTPSRRRIFTCQPTTGVEETRCARAILENLATRAYRNPVDEASMARLMNFFEKGRELRGFETGIQYALERMIVDPQFIYRFEEEPEELAAGEVYQISAYELASRLSFFLWSSIPDDELLELAGTGQLLEPAVLNAQVRRMLADSRSSALVENFASHWLSLRKLQSVNPISPDFDGSLRQAMQRETELLFESILREGRSIVDLLDADYTFVNERLARHYGIPNIRGDHFRRIQLPMASRRGILGHSSILTLTSAPDRTSPVIRGTWIMENILGMPPPPPPPGVETNLAETAAAGTAPTTIRQRLERHRADPSCAACHNLIDPIGFALENFDSTGKWRDTSAGQPVDATAEFWDGSFMAGPEDLLRALLQKRDLFVETATRKLMTYALGRAVEHSDMPAVWTVVQEAADDGYRFDALVQGIVASQAFQMRRKAALEPQGQLSQIEAD